MNIWVSCVPIGYAQTSFLLSGFPTGGLKWTRTTDLVLIRHAL